MFNPGWATLAIYLVLVNAVVHIAHALLFRCYNPGLVSALVLFLPLGAGSLWLLPAAGGVSAAYQVIGLATALLIHAAILIHVRRKLARLQAEQPAA